jgi:PAS domain S-box-containing protein
MRDGRDGDDAPAHAGAGGLSAAALRALAEADRDAVGAALTALRDGLDAGLAFAGRIAGDRVTVPEGAALGRGGAVAPFAYALAAAPCAEAAESGRAIRRDGAGDAHPGAAHLLGMRGYAGAAIRDADGRAAGVLAVATAGPLPDDPGLPPALEALADRIGAYWRAEATAARLAAAEAALAAEREARAAAEARLADVVAAVSEWYWETDAQGRFVYVAGAASAAFGVDAAWFAGKTRREVVAAMGDPDEPPDLAALDRLTAAGSPFRDFTYAIRDPHGRRRWIRIAGAPVRGADCAVTGWRGAGAEATALVEKDRALRAAEQRLRDGIEAMDAGFALFDADERLVMCNRAYGALSDAMGDACRFVGATFETLVRGFAAGGLYADPRARDDPDAFAAERMAQFRAADGRPREQALSGRRWVEITERRTAEGGIVLVRTDVTARKLSEMRLRDGVEAMGATFALFDADDRLILCNAAYRRLAGDVGARPAPLGLTFETLVREALAVGAYDDALARDDPEAFLARRMAHRRAADGAPHEVRVAGPRWIEIREMQTSDGGVAMVQTDVTARKLSEMRLRDGIEALDAGFALFDAEDRLAMCNHVFAELMARSGDPRERIGATFEEALRASVEAGALDEHPEAAADPEGFVAWRLARHSDPDGRPFELRLKGPRWVEIREHRTAEGGVALIRSDVTARKLSELRLLDGIEAMPGGFALFDADDRLTLCNEAFRRLFKATGRPARAGVGFAELYAAALDHGLLADPRARTDRSGLIADRMARHRAADGRGGETRLADGRWAEVSERRTAEGGVVLVSRDITELKRSQMRLLDAIDGVPVGFMLCDADDRLVLCNRRFRELYPEWADLLEPGTPFDRIAPPDAGAEGARTPPQAWREARLRPEGPPVQTMTAAGRSVLVADTRTATGERVGVHLDVTPFVLLQRELAQATGRAEAALDARSRFLANISHELRTPLNAVIGLSELIRVEAHGPLAPKYVEYAGLVKQAGEFLLSLIVDILDMSRLEAGRMELDFEPVDLAEIAARATGLLTAQASAKGLALALEPPDPPLPPVPAEPRRLTQIMVNLLSNAVKFTHAGRVALSWRAEGDRALIAVADTGVGMTAEEAERALRPFEQVRSLARREYLEGTGLGLPLVKALAELHGGGLTLRSAPGEGTCAEVWLPMRRD